MITEAYEYFSNIYNDVLMKDDKLGYHGEGIRECFGDILVDKYQEWEEYFNVHKTGDEEKAISLSKLYEDGTIQHSVFYFA